MQPTCTIYNIVINNIKNVHFCVWKHWFKKGKISLMLSLVTVKWHFCILLKLNWIRKKNRSICAWWLILSRCKTRSRHSRYIPTTSANHYRQPLLWDQSNGTGAMDHKRTVFVVNESSRVVHCINLMRTVNSLTDKCIGEMIIAFVITLLRWSHLTLGNASSCLQSVHEYLGQWVRRAMAWKQRRFGGCESAEEAGESSESRAQRNLVLSVVLSERCTPIQLDGGSLLDTGHRGSRTNQKQNPSSFIKYVETRNWKRTFRSILFGAIWR